MTRRLEKALAELSRLSDEEQDAIASLILAELQDEQRWDGLFASTSEPLSRWVKTVQDEIDRGQSRELDPDEL